MTSDTKQCSSDCDCYGTIASDPSEGENVSGHHTLGRLFESDVDADCKVDCTYGDVALSHFRVAVTTAYGGDYSSAIESYLRDANALEEKLLSRFLDEPSFADTVQVLVESVGEDRAKVLMSNPNIRQIAKDVYDEAKEAAIKEFLLRVSEMLNHSLNAYELKTAYVMLSRPHVGEALYNAP